ncbi:hypothetical protein ACOSQ2_007243 [Xanthoceras sorbifolium]
MGSGCFVRVHGGGSGVDRLLLCIRIYGFRIQRPSESCLGRYLVRAYWSVSYERLLGLRTLICSIVSLLRKIRKRSLVFP